MIDALIHASLRHRALVIFVALLLCLYGGWQALRLPIDVFPDLTAPTATILCEARGMTATDLERRVTRPVESALNGARGVRRIRSMTHPGVAVISVDFGWDFEPLDARRVVDERLSLVNDKLPEGVTPFLAPVSSIMGEVLFVGVRSDNLSALDVRTWVDVRLRRRLLAVPGVSQVSVIGGAVKQYQVTLAPSRLASHDVSFAEVHAALRSDNRNVSAGFIDDNGNEYVVQGEGRFRSREDISSVVVRQDDGVPVVVSDLGEVVVGEAPSRGEASVNGRSAVVVTVQKQPGANTLELTGRLLEVLDDMESSAPAGVRIERNLFRQGEFIEVAIDNVLEALRDGGALVVIIMLVFLVSARATLITLTAIPLSLVAAVIALQFVGGTMNTMTLGGMAIASGALVDDAVIDVENVVRRLRQNATLPTARRRALLVVVYEASKEIRGSIAFATLIVVLVFVPVFFLPGVEGRLLQPLGIAYVVALAASLLVALTVTPALCLWLLPRSRAVRGDLEPRFATALKRGYRRLLEVLLVRPWAVTAPSAGLLVGAIVAFALTGRSFLPEFNEGALTINATTLPGIALADSDRLARIVEDIVLARPEVVSTARRTGRAELDEHIQGVNSTEIEVRLDLGGHDRDMFLDELRGNLASVRGVNIEIGQPISHRIDHMLSGTRANLAVKIFGDDLDVLRSLGAAVERRIESVEGVVDLLLEQQTEVQSVSVRWKRPVLARHGLSVEEASKTLEAAVQGLRVSELIEGQKRVEIVMRLGREEGNPLSSLRGLTVDTPSGARVRLGDLADVERQTGPNRISRENVERKIVVSLNVVGRDIGSVVSDIRERVSPLFENRQGYRMELGGQFESAQAANRVVLSLGFVVIIGIGFLLHMAFGSVRDTLFVMLNLPLALIGAVAGVWVSGGVLSVASLIGCITVFGIATRNGILLVSHVRHLEREEGVTDFREAVLRGSVERLLPILMTAVGTAFALVPLAFSGGEPGSEIQTPMAIVILCGLVSATILNMIVVPALFLRFGKQPVGLAGGDSR